MKKPTLFKRCRNWLAGGTLVCGIIALLLLNNSSSMLAQDGPAAAPDSTALFDAPTYSSPIALSADKNHIWVVNPDAANVSVIRTDTNRFRQHAMRPTMLPGRRRGRRISSISSITSGPKCRPPRSRRKPSCVHSRTSRSEPRSRRSSALPMRSVSISIS